MPSEWLIPGTLPEGFCQLTPQEQFNVMASLLQISSATSFDTLLIQAETPGVNQRQKAWLRLEGANLTPDKIYKWALGQWIAKNLRGPGERMIWFESEADLWLYDGGDGSNPAVTAPTSTSGAMWERDTDFDARFMVGAGTFPSGASVGLGDEGGEEQVTLTVPQLPAHTHDLILNADTPPPDVELCLATQSDGTQQTTVTTEATGDGEPHTNLPPYVGIFVAKRTVRQFYVAP